MDSEAGYALSGALGAPLCPPTATGIPASGTDLSGSALPARGTPWGPPASPTQAGMPYRGAELAQRDRPSAVVDAHVKSELSLGDGYIPSGTTLPPQWTGTAGLRLSNRSYPKTTPLQMEVHFQSLLWGRWSINDRIPLHEGVVPYLSTQTCDIARTVTGRLGRANPSAASSCIL